MKVRCWRTGIRLAAVGASDDRDRCARCSRSMTAGASGFHHGTPWDTRYHSPALAAEVVALLGGSALVLDGTLGGGGPAAALLEGGVGRVMGVDPDAEVLAEATERLADAAAAGRFTAL